uniref:G-protein coupled receptors family 1 profile domain-containing protein n=1 Tax=Pseudonaja textilis TaxID=8673 RepID=A0A670ZKV0_PSETE
MKLVKPSELQNTTVIGDFILLGFGNTKNLNIFLFDLFLIIYIVTVSGNILIITLVVAEKRLHTPMYFYLSNLSFLEISTECYLLAAMSYDRYLAICRPLHYVILMNCKTCVLLVSMSWIIGFMLISVLTSLLTQFTFCNQYKIDHFFCDFTPLIQLSCTFVISIFVILGPCAVTLFSYIYFTIHPSAKGQQKAFSTCSSHLAVVIIWYGSTIFLYVKPSKWTSLEMTKLVNILNTVVTPLHNPFICTLWNKEVKEVFKHTLCWH